MPNRRMRAEGGEAGGKARTDCARVRKIMHAEEDAHRGERDDEAVQAGAHDDVAVDAAERAAERRARRAMRERPGQAERLISQPNAIAAQTPMAPTARLSPPVTITTIIEKPITMLMAATRPSVKRLNGDRKPWCSSAKHDAEHARSATSRPNSLVSQKRWSRRPSRARLALLDRPAGARGACRQQCIARIRTWPRPDGPRCIDVIDPAPVARLRRSPGSGRGIASVDAVAYLQSR